MQITPEQIIPAIASALLGLFAFLVRHYFASIRKDIGRLEKDIATTQGHIAALQADIRANTTEMIRATSEVKAIWRAIDGSYKRASDIHHSNNGG